MSETRVKDDKPDFSIREACQRDLSDLAEMISRLSTHHQEVASVTLADLERDLFTMPPWAYAFVVTGAHGLVGYAVLNPVIRLHFGLRGMNLHHMFMTDDHRGSGLGRRLVGHCMNVARDMRCSYMTVGVHPDNLPAQKFYMDVGFEPVGEDLTFMKLNL